jgi:myo-inositol 2-dehydrogenase/D-chiro-inositol 1-dehydrogenase
MAIKAALIGVTSWYSTMFARSLRALGPARATLVGAAHLGVDDDTLLRLSKLTRDGFGERFGTRMFERAADLLDATQPDVVLVTAPNTERARYAAMALEAGADVFIAKPMTNSVRDAAQIRDAARRHPQRLAGALDPARFATAIREAHRRVAAGEIGEVLTARAWIQHGAPNATPGARKGNPESDDDQGGPAYSLGVYAADLLNWFAGAAAHPAVRTFAEFGTLNVAPGSGYPWMDSGKAVVRYGADKMGSMDIYHSVPIAGPLWEIEVGGRDGLLRTNGANYEGTIWRRPPASRAPGLERPRLEPFAPTVDDTILNAITHVVDCCEQRRPFEMDAEDGYRAIELCAAWKQSAATHEPVVLPLG